MNGSASINARADFQSSSVPSAPMLCNRLLNSVRRSSVARSSSVRSKQAEQSQSMPHPSNSARRSRADCASEMYGISISFPAGIISIAVTSIVRALTVKHVIAFGRHEWLIMDVCSAIADMSRSANALFSQMLTIRVACSRAEAGKSANSSEISSGFDDGLSWKNRSRICEGALCTAETKSSRSKCCPSCLSTCNSSSSKRICSPT